jgi:hypothetical protein
MELIDRAALGVGRCSKDILPAAYCAGWNGLLNIINDAPTISAVPVVRCARCRHGEAFKTFPGGIFCPYIKDTVPPDGYCYMGEENPYD